jgi:hypothetical protein
MRKRSLAPVCAVIGIALVAGCGSDSSKKASVPAASQTSASSTPSASLSTPSASVSTPSASASAPSSVAAAAAALPALRKIVLKPTDLPAGWKPTPHKANPSDEAGNVAMLKCVGARNTDGDKVAEANSDDFAAGDAQISSSATSYRSQADLDTDLAMLRSPKLSPCLEQLLKKELASSLPAGGTVGSTSVKVTPGSAGGPANVAATATAIIKVSVNGQQIPAYMSLAFITGPLIEAEVDSDNIGAPVAASVLSGAVAAVANRAAKG